MPAMTEELTDRGDERRPWHIKVVPVAVEPGQRDLWTWSIESGDLKWGGGGEYRRPTQALTAAVADIDLYWARSRNGWHRDRS